MSRKPVRVAVVGAGASGLMAAQRAAELGADVVLLEKTGRPGNKLRISGKGHCNVTNDGDVDDFIANFGPKGKFLRNSFSRFFNRDLVNFFERRGVRLVTERGGRIFPESGEADEIADCLIRSLREMAVEMRNDFPVYRIMVKEGRACGVIGKSSEELPADRVIVATGGASYPLTGSTGDGFRWAAALGHHVRAPIPALVPLEVAEDYARSMAGLTLKNIGITAYQRGRKFREISGDMIFTHFGVSGPVVLTISREIVERLDRGPVQLAINFKPALRRDILDARLLRELDENGDMLIKNILKHLLPYSAIPVFLKRLRWSGEERGCSITKGQRADLLELLSDFRLTVTRSRPISEAIVTSGGVELKEVDPRTMESRIVRRLYFCGEVLDIDANTGGYNLQAAFTTGWVAGESAAGKIGDEDSLD
jgi:predicted Rossmann fold flavoprotein